MKKIYLLILGVLIFNAPTKAQTWATEIAPIIYNNCTKCHHDGGIAPFSLMTYSEVTNRIAGIKYQVEQGSMPPWPADQQYRHYAYERVLKPSEINAIVNWANAGTPSGDLSKAPAQPVYLKGSKIGAYDLKIKIPVYTSTATTGDVYRCFSIQSGVKTEQFISDIEIVPGNPKIVHHVLVFQDTTNTTNQLDNQDPLPGYTNFGGTGSNNSVLMAPYVPGSEPVHFPKSTGIKMFRNSNVILQIHYPEGTDGEIDSTYVLIRFAKPGSTREVFIAPILNHGNITNGPFAIPANSVKTFYQSMTVPIDASLLSVMPHMHLIGKSTKVFAKPLIADTIPLVRINDWDFHWQGEYKFQYLQKIPKGSKLQSIVTYDNTSANPNQPSDPPKLVTLGEATTSEMMLTYFYYMAYQSGDENILQDSSLLLSTPRLRDITGIQLFPNPSGQKFQIHLPNNVPNAHLQVLNLLGQTVFESTLNQANTSIEHQLTPGIYHVRISTNDGTWNEKLQVIKE